MEPTHRRIDTNYSTIEKIGEGAFGVVYKGFSRRHNCNVAIKKLNPEGASKWYTDEKFRRETNILKDVKHPNVVILFDVLESDEDVYIIM